MEDFPGVVSREYSLLSLWPNNGDEWCKVAPWSTAQIAAHILFQHAGNGDDIRLPQHLISSHPTSGEAHLFAAYLSTCTCTVHGGWEHVKHINVDRVEWIMTQMWFWKCVMLLGFVNFKEYWDLISTWLPLSSMHWGNYLLFTASF